MKVSIVVDLGFGDAGKGITVDYLAAQQPEKSLVIRFSGGQQVGHTVRVGDFIHTFSNFGAGTMRGVPTYYSPYCTIFPPAILTERAHIAQFNPQLIIHPQAMVTTPYDIAYNRATEKVNGHGSCGVGFGATIERNESPVKLFAQDLTNNWVLTQKLTAVKNHYKQKLEQLYNPSLMKTYQQELEDYDNEAFINICEESLSYFQINTLQNISDQYAHFIFEGSQGIMLDQVHGIFPHVTRSYTTSKNAWEIIGQDLPKSEEMNVYYVTRCYQTRHGNGPMSNTEPVNLMNHEDEANQLNQYQGAFRTVQLDTQLLNYALEVDSAYQPPTTHKHLVITCLDQLPSFQINKFLNDLNKDFKTVLGSYASDSKAFKILRER